MVIQMYMRLYLDGFHYTYVWLMGESRRKEWARKENEYKFDNLHIRYILKNNKSYFAVVQRNKNYFKKK